MLTISAIAFIKAPTNARLPMQWGVDDQVSWSLPIKWAVLFMPIFTALIIAFVLFMIKGEAIPESGEVFTALIVCVPPILIHFGHMFFAVRQLNKSR